MRTGFLAHLAHRCPLHPEHAVILALEWILDSSLEASGEFAANEVCDVGSAVEMRPSITPS